MAGPLLVTFSGIDGAGKSTQIEGLRSTLHAAGVPTRLLAFWDDVVVGARYREGFVHKVYKSERGVGAPGRPVQRRDKNMRGRHLTAARHLLYLLDTIHLRRVVARERKAARAAKGQDAAQVIILDRYIYDELANLNLRNPLSRAFVKLARWLAPRPDIAYLLDADPAAAHARKPEYPVAFMKQSRRAYFDLAGLLGTMTVIPALALPEAKLAVLKAAQRKLAASGRAVELDSSAVPAA